MSEPLTEAKRPVTIEDVARAVGMHKSTVSLALSGKGTVGPATRARVRRAAQELGYEPSILAQRLASGSNPLVYLFSGALDGGVATDKIRRIQTDLTGRGLEVPIYASLASTEQAARTQTVQLRQICRQRPRAIICAAQAVSPDALSDLSAYQEMGGIVVSYDMPVALECDQVVFDREHNAYQAARALLERGHRRIGLGMDRAPAWLAGSPSVPETHRLRGFRRALEEFGASFREEWLLEGPPPERGGEVMARQFLELRDRPTGLCIVNDYAAFAFMVDVMRAGIRVPEEVSIVGHDNRDIAARCPVPLTCATQPIEEIARTVVELLVSRLEGDAGPPRSVTIRGELVERESVAAPGKVDRS